MIFYKDSSENAIPLSGLSDTKYKDLKEFHNIFSPLDEIEMDASVAILNKIIQERGRGDRLFSDIVMAMLQNWYQKALLQNSALVKAINFNRVLLAENGFRYLGELILSQTHSGITEDDVIDTKLTDFKIDIFPKLKTNCPTFVFVAGCQSIPMLESRVLGASRFIYHFITSENSPGLHDIVIVLCGKNPGGRSRITIPIEAELMRNLLQFKLYDLLIKNKPAEIPSNLNPEVTLQSVLDKTVLEMDSITTKDNMQKFLETTFEDRLPDSANFVFISSTSHILRVYSEFKGVVREHFKPKDKNFDIDAWLSSKTVLLVGSEEGNKNLRLIDEHSYGHQVLENYDFIFKQKFFNNGNR